MVVIPSVKSCCAAHELWHRHPTYWKRLLSYKSDIIWIFSKQLSWATKFYEFLTHQNFTFKFHCFRRVMLDFYLILNWQILVFFFYCQYTHTCFVTKHNLINMINILKSNRCDEFVDMFSFVYHQFYCSKKKKLGSI